MNKCFRLNYYERFSISSDEVTVHSQIITLFMVVHNTYCVYSKDTTRFIDINIINPTVLKYLI